MGCLHIYCGDGKGKTTASLGFALRAAGAGMTVCFTQFMKGRETSELISLEKIPEIEVFRCDRDYGFYNKMSDKDKSDITDCHNELLRTAFTGGYKLIILDEFNSAFAYGLLDKALAAGLILNGVNSSEIVLTGRNPADIFVEAADYISKINCIKHPYTKGIPARRGIEY